MTTNHHPLGETSNVPYPAEIPKGHYSSEPQKAPKDPFEYQKPNDDQTRRIQRVRESCRDMASILKNNIKPSRELSLALTKLEEMSMWANKGIVFEDES